MKTKKRLRPIEEKRQDLKYRKSRRELWNWFQQQKSGEGYTRTQLGKMFRAKFPDRCPAPAKKPIARGRLRARRARR